MFEFTKQTLSHLATLVLISTSVQAVAEEPMSPAPEMTKLPDPIAVPPAAGTVPAALVQLGAGQYLSNHAFVMDKANRTLTVWKQDETGGLTLVTAVPADFGRAGGNKVSAGDHKTPEGIYFFQAMKEGKTLSYSEYGIRAFTLDYPNFFDKLDKKSGSGIWLHSIPNSKSLLRGSRGCVVVRNEVVTALSPYITLKRTPILIQDAVKYVDAATANNMRSTWQAWMKDWLASWQSKNLDEYISNYGPSFKSMGMNLDQWKTYKKNLNEKYTSISVLAREPVMVIHGNEMLVRFIQDYKSDKNSDFGEKTLYLRKENDKFKIVGEEWQATARDEVIATHEQAPTTPTTKQ